MNKPNTIEKLLQDKGRQFELEILAGEDYISNEISGAELNRPGLAYAGFLDVYVYDRIQIIGNTETEYLKNLEDKIRVERLENCFAYDIPCIIITAGNSPADDFLEIAEKHKIPVISTPIPTTRFSSLLTFYLEREFAPTKSIHGVLVDVFGVGVLIQGSAGVGKSEAALELIERGHRLVADDAVIIKRLAKNLIVGSAVTTVQHLMEVRGLGIVDVELLFGAGSVREEKSISLVVRLEQLNEYSDVDRLGMDENFTTILDVDVREFTIPVEPGRNTSILVEVAALQHRIQLQGRNPARELNERLIKQMQNQPKKPMPMDVD